MTKVKKAVAVKKETAPKKKKAEKLLLKLYIAGKSPKSLRAIENLERLCEEHLKGGYDIEVIDLSKNPALAKKHEIVALPTLVRQLPHPIRKIIGDLSSVERTLIGLQVNTTSND